MTLGDWQGAAVVATIMIVVTLIVVKTIKLLSIKTRQERCFLK